MILIAKSRNPEMILFIQIYEIMILIPVCGNHNILMLIPIYRNRVVILIQDLYIRILIPVCGIVVSRYLILYVRSYHDT